MVQYYITIITEEIAFDGGALKKYYVFWVIKTAI